MGELGRGKIMTICPANGSAFYHHEGNPEGDASSDGKSALDMLSHDPVVTAGLAP